MSSNITAVRCPDICISHTFPGVKDIIDDITKKTHYHDYHKGLTRGTKYSN